MSEERPTRKRSVAFTRTSSGHWKGVAQWQRIDIELDSMRARLQARQCGWRVADCDIDQLSNPSASARCPTRRDPMAPSAVKSPRALHFGTSARIRGTWSQRTVGYSRIQVVRRIATVRPSAAGRALLARLVEGKHSFCAMRRSVYAACARNCSANPCSDHSQ